MVNQDEILHQLREKFKRLISYCDSLKAENISLKAENAGLKSQLEKRNDEYNQIASRYQSLNAARALAGTAGNSEDAKNKITGIVREIDKCIALLNQ